MCGQRRDANDVQHLGFFVEQLGSGEHGQLGNGRTGEIIVSAGRIGFESSSKPILVKGDLGSVKIVEVACGSAHTVARDSEGMVYAWGVRLSASITRWWTVIADSDLSVALSLQRSTTATVDWVSLIDLHSGCPLTLLCVSSAGLQDQKDRLVPTMIPQFAKENKLLRAKTISCGPACSVRPFGLLLLHHQSQADFLSTRFTWQTVTDNSVSSVYRLSRPSRLRLTLSFQLQGIYYIAGRYKVSGEGSGGTPNREFKYLQDMQGCRVFKTSSGNATHFALAAEHDKGSKATLTIGFGQSVAHSGAFYFILLWVT